MVEALLELFFWYNGNLHCRISFKVHHILKSKTELYPDCALVPQDLRTLIHEEQPQRIEF